MDEKYTIGSQENPDVIDDEEIEAHDQSQTRLDEDNTFANGMVDSNSQSQLQSDLIDSQKVVDYKTWKKNCPILYDYIQTTSLLWPSLTIQWFPDIDQINLDIVQQRILTGSYSSGNSKIESLNVSSIKYLSNPSNVIGIESHDIIKNEFINNQVQDKLDKISILQKIPHRLEANRARYMPQNPDVIGSICSDGSVSIYNRTKHPNSFNEEEEFKLQQERQSELQSQSQSQSQTTDSPFNEYDEELASEFCDIKLKFHKSDGWGISWNQQREGELITGASDGLIALWDITKLEKNNNNRSSTSVLHPVTYTTAHDYGVNDLEYLWCHDSIISTAGEDGLLKIFDKRQDLKQVCNENGNKFEKKSVGINTLSWNKKNEFGISVGDSNGDLSFYDIRKMSKSIKDIKSAHDSGITCLEWNHTNHSVIASGSSDGLVKIWNIKDSKNNESEQGDINSDFDKDLVFVHGGHMLGVNDLSWNPSDKWCIASCSDDNSVHVWKPAIEILKKLK
ncbi:hypothetical protein B5S33_g2374 [[Candida] boidinii]|nr:hypothetical protein B5S33_g2374 [[Candida] boidinii]